MQSEYAGAAGDPRSIVTPIGYQSRNSCGYCKSGSGGSAYYAIAVCLSAQHYQDLLDRGWRRSGTTLYKPDLAHSCCPHYTIRLDASQFKPTKDKRQALHRWSRYVLGTDYMSRASVLYPKSREEKARRRNHFDLLDSVHSCEYERLNKPPEPDHKFEVTLEKDNFTEEKYELYRNYQQNVHHEPASKTSRHSFKRFLCSSPLKRDVARTDGQEKRLGSYHQCYRLDGRLVAMAVLDLLPRCVSAVYFIYHNEMAPWNLGKVSALREAALAAEGEYRYYYMGYYIHSCIKMRYKRGYGTQFVLDPESYSWDPLDETLLRKLGEKHYVSLARERREAEKHLQEEDSTAMNPDVDKEGANGEDVVTDPKSDHAHSDDVDDEDESLFGAHMPGVMTRDEVKDKVDLDRVRFRIRDLDVEAQDLLGWPKGDIDTPHSLKAYVAQFVAAVGPRLAREIVIQP